MRFKVKFFHDDAADLYYPPLGRLILTEASNQVPMMKNMQETATKIGANRFDVHDANKPDEFKRVRKYSGDSWKSDMVRIADEAKHRKAEAYR